jgi:CRISPR system Cascade subunit CasD
MRDFILVRLDAPLMSFGGVKVDKRGVTADFPGLSMVSGLLGNALGYDHRDVESLSALQRRIRFAVRRDRRGERIVDYQTVDLGQEHLAAEAWTTRGAAEGRAGGTASEGTHIRLREFWADAVFTVAVTLEPETVSPTLDDLARALETPERPLFIGRKACLPARPVFLGRLRAPSLAGALLDAERLPPQRSEGAQQLTAWLPHDEPFDGPSREVPVFDERDWANQIVAGRRMVRQIVLTFSEVKHGG